MALLVAGMLMLNAATVSDEELQAFAEQANVPVEDLAGAVATTGMDPYNYLVATGHINPPRTLNSAVERRLDCIRWYESKGDNSARNRSSGAAGPYQFLGSTWRTTPQGKAGYSPYDPVASREAARWMIGQGRIKEWVPVQLGLC